MKIDRAALRQAVTDALAAHKTRFDTRHAEWAAALETHRTQWLDAHAEEWREATKKINRKLRDGKVVTDADLPRDHYRNQRTYDTPHRIKRPDGGYIERPRDETYRQPAELVALGKALDVITDQEITHTALRALGITGATLRDAITQLGRANQ